MDAQFNRKKLYCSDSYLFNREKYKMIYNFFICFWIFCVKMVSFWHCENGISDQPNGGKQKFQAGFKFNTCIITQTNIIYQYLVILL